MLCVHGSRKTANVGRQLRATNISSGEELEGMLWRCASQGQAGEVT